LIIIKVLKYNNYLEVRKIVWISIHKVLTFSNKLVIKFKEEGLKITFIYTLFSDKKYYRVFHKTV